MGTSLTVIERAAVAFGDSFQEQQLNALVEESKEIVAITNEAGYQQCHAARMKLKNKRIAITKTGKEVRDDANTFSALQLMHAGTLAQEQAKAAEEARVKAEREELAKLRAEQEERNRQEALQRAEAEKVAKAQREAEEAAAKAVREAEAEKLAAERAEFERERQAQIEADRYAQAVSDAKAAEVRAEQQAEAKRLQDQRDELARQQEAIEAQRKASEPTPATTNTTAGLASAPANEGTRETPALSQRETPQGVCDVLSVKVVADTYDLVAHLYRQREFSLRTFGPGTRLQGVLQHVRKELIEIESDPSDVFEWIDGVLLLLDGAWRHGHSPEAIAEALAAKQAKNEARTWPDYRLFSEDEPIQHVREIAA